MSSGSAYRKAAKVPLPPVPALDLNASSETIQAQVNARLEWLDRHGNACSARRYKAILDRTKRGEEEAIKSRDFHNSPTDRSELLKFGLSAIGCLGLGIAGMSIGSTPGQAPNLLGVPGFFVGGGAGLYAAQRLDHWINKNFI